MNVNSVKKFCLSFSSATEKEFGEPSNVLTYYVVAINSLLTSFDTHARAKARWHN